MLDLIKKVTALATAVMFLLVPVASQAQTLPVMGITLYVNGANSQAAIPSGATPAVLSWASYGVKSCYIFAPGSGINSAAVANPLNGSETVTLNPAVTPFVTITCSPTSGTVGAASTVYLSAASGSVTSTSTTSGAATPTLSNVVVTASKSGTYTLNFNVYANGGEIEIPTIGNIPVDFPVGNPVPQSKAQSQNPTSITYQVIGTTTLSSSQQSSYLNSSNASITQTAGINSSAYYVIPKGTTRHFTFTVQLYPAKTASYAVQFTNLKYLVKGSTTTQTLSLGTSYVSNSVLLSGSGVSSPGNPGCVYPPVGVLGSTQYGSGLSGQPVSPSSVNSSQAQFGSQSAVYCPGTTGSGWGGVGSPTAASGKPVINVTNLTATAAGVYTVTFSVGASGGEVDIPTSAGAPVNATSTGATSAVYQVPSVTYNVATIATNYPTSQIPSFKSVDAGLSSDGSSYVISQGTTRHFSYTVKLLPTKTSSYAVQFIRLNYGTPSTSGLPTSSIAFPSLTKTSFELLFVGSSSGNGGTGTTTTSGVGTPSISAGSATANGSGAYTATFAVTANGGEVDIPSTTGLNYLVAGIPTFVGSQNSTLTSRDASLVATSSSSYYVVPAGTTRHFVQKVTIVPSVTGSYGLRFTSLNYNPGKTLNLPAPIVSGWTAAIPGSSASGTSSASSTNAIPEVTPITLRATGGSISGLFVGTFSVKADNGDVYIPVNAFEDTATSTIRRGVDSFVYKVVGSKAFSGGSSAVLTSTNAVLQTVNRTDNGAPAQFYVVPEHTTRNFTVTIHVSPSQTGSYGVQFEKLGFSSGNGNYSSVTLPSSAVTNWVNISTLTTSGSTSGSTSGNTGGKATVAAGAISASVSGAFTVNFTVTAAGSDVRVPLGIANISSSPSVSETGLEYRVVATTTFTGTQSPGVLTSWDATGVNLAQSVSTGATKNAYYLVPAGTTKHFTARFSISPTKGASYAIQPTILNYAVGANTYSLPLGSSLQTESVQMRGTVSGSSSGSGPSTGTVAPAAAAGTPIVKIGQTEGLTTGIYSVGFSVTASGNEVDIPASVNTSTGGIVYKLNGTPTFSGFQFPSITSSDAVRVQSGGVTYYSIPKGATKHFTVNLSLLTKLVGSYSLQLTGMNYTDSTHAIKKSISLPSTFVTTKAVIKPPSTYSNGTAFRYSASVAEGVQSSLDALTQELQSLLSQ